MIRFTTSIAIFVVALTALPAEAKNGVSVSNGLDIVTFVGTVRLAPQSLSTKQPFGPRPATEQPVAFVTEEGPAYQAIGAAMALPWGKSGWDPYSGSARWHANLHMAAIDWKVGLVKRIPAET
ncbi:hypothetical protein ASG43_17425 [Aureimonas sp. Leaf454]|uniref:hypothetical protein n=1 Tax=Aureimonas sp. Leaf454 TaxID=1736381 RepID=UPI0006F4747E|nr:hypothetical protein [Aureimonas sp. Leaf454]KQT42056.1 hypothetical protein ASG43_17425 [Aureimonas sp. Leaf454]